MDLLDTSYLSFVVMLLFTLIPLLFVLALIAAAIRWLWYHAKS